MRRGTTPTIVLTVDNNYDLSRATDIWATFEQSTSGTEITHKWKRYPDVDDDESVNRGIVIDGQNVVVTLSQAETLEFAKGSVDVQVKFKRDDFDEGTIYDEVASTVTKRIKVEDILNEEIM